MAQANDYAADLEWAWNNLGKSDLQENEAPHGAAFFLWKWGRDSPDKFIPLVTRVLGKKDDEKDAALRDDAKQQFDLLALFREEAGISGASAET